MPPQRTSKAGPSKASVSADRHRKPAKKEKVLLPVEERVRKSWKSIKSQISDGYLEKALKRCDRILELQPENELARQIHIQLLLGLDRYREALQYIDRDETRSQTYAVERSYALYKLGRFEQAATTVKDIKTASSDADIERTTAVLEAQVEYRLEQFETAQTLYEDLLADTDRESPEYADLTSNLDACNSYVDFMSTVTSRLGDMAHSSTHTLPSVEMLETTPIAPLIAAHHLYKPRGPQAVVAMPQASSSAALKSKKATASKPRLPPAVAALPEEQRPAPDPERWLPKRERKGYAEVIAAREREKEKRRLKMRKKLEATMTQGIATEDPNKSMAAPVQQGAAAQKPHKKKKKTGNR